MYLLSVSPFLKAFRKDELWYFSTNFIDPGKIVTVNLKNKPVKALVLNCVEADKNKSEIKNSNFSLKKVSGISKSQFLNEAFIKAATETAEYFATSTGSVLNYLLPKSFLEEYSKFNYPENFLATEKETGRFVVQLPDEERFSEYKSLIRGRFAKDESVIFCVPTNEDALIAKERISKGIEANTFILNLNQNKKEFLTNWQAIINSKKPVLLIVTAPFLFTPVRKLGLIIVERENSAAYKIQVRPYFDIRIFIEKYAKNLGADFLLGDLMLRSETLKRYDESYFYEYTPIKFRLIGTAKNYLINTNKEQNPASTEFNTISYDLKNILKKSLSENKKSFLLVSRKGLAPLVLCADCGELVTCNDCHSPVSLFGKDATKKQNIFKCKHCNASRGAGEVCKKCGSWRLMSFGIGTEKVYEDLNKIFPETKIFILDKEKTKTPIQAKKVIDSFYNEPSAILVGTEMALLYLKEEVDTTAVVSIDALFTVPDYKIRERILNILLRVKIKARDFFVIQTRNPDDRIFTQAIDGNLSDFYREEFINRKKFNYPPFSFMIKFRFKESTKAKLEKIIEETEKTFDEYEMFVYDSFLEKKENKFIMNGLLKIPQKDWPNKDLVEKIKSLPPNIDVVVEADSAL